MTKADPRLPPVLPESSAIADPGTGLRTGRVFAGLLAPLGEREFFDTHWERGPLHVGRAEPDRFADLVSLDDIERLLSARELRFPDVQLTRAGTPVPLEAYADEASRILPRRLIERHRDGATVVLSRANDLFPRLKALVRAVEVELGWRCQTNVYLSPPGNRGFGSHYDTHDVLILQVAGRKTFRFYSGGVELPFCDERYDPDSTGERIPGETIELAPGDTLYIPRGVLHDAVAHADTSSLHITLGVFPLVLRDVLREAVQVAAERDVGLRRSVAPAMGRVDARGDGDGSIERRLRALLSSALDEAVLGEALSRLRDDVSLDGAPDCTGLLSGRDAARTLSPDTSLVVRGGVAGALERRDSVLKLRLSGEVLELGEPMATALEWLVAAGAGTLGRLPGLDGSQRLALARQLLEHGVVDVTDA